MRPKAVGGTVEQNQVVVEVTAAFFEYRLGRGSGFEALFQLPVYNIRFDDFAGDRSSTGIGDLRAGARWNFTQDTVVATLGAAVKFPTGEFVNDAEIVPVGEGQTDFEVDVEVGRSLWPRPGYVNGRFGYRFRTENEENGIDPGDEVFWSLEGGYRWIPNIRLLGGELALVRLLLDELRHRRYLAVDELLEAPIDNDGLGQTGSPQRDPTLGVAGQNRGRHWWLGAIVGGVLRPNEWATGCQCQEGA